MKTSKLLPLLLFPALLACSSTPVEEQNNFKALGGFGLAQSCEEVLSYVNNYADRFKQNADQAVAVTHGFQVEEPVSLGSPDVATGESAAPAAAGTQVLESDFAFADSERGLVHAFNSNREWQIYQVSPLATANLLSSISLDFYPQEMIAIHSGTKHFAVLFGTNQVPYVPLAESGTVPMQKLLAPFPDPTSDPPLSVTVVYDVTQAQSPQEVYRETAPGTFWTARGLSATGQVVWVTWRDIPIYQGQLNAEDILPTRTQVGVNGNQSLPATECSGIYLYQNDTLNSDYAPYVLSATTVSLLDLNNLGSGSSTQAILSPSWNAIVQANSEHLFLAQNVDGAERSDTEIFVFNLGKGNPALQLAAGGAVPGQIPNRHFIDEWQGTLRIFHHVWAGSTCPGCEGSPGTVTSTGPLPAQKFATEPSTGNYLTLLQVQGQSLQGIGQIGPFETEEVPFAARFMDAFGCVVTFKQIDPLTCFDLKSPTNPRQMGSLHLAGVSFHLEPVTDELWLGIGRGGDGNSIVANLFDVRDTAHPGLADQKTLSTGLTFPYSPAFYDDRALGKDLVAHLFSVPIESSEKARLAVLQVNTDTKKILVKGNIDKLNDFNNGYDAFLRGFIFNDGIAALSYQALSLFNLGNLQGVKSWPLDIP